MSQKTKTGLLNLLLKDLMEDSESLLEIKKWLFMIVLPF